MEPMRFVQPMNARIKCAVFWVDFGTHLLMMINSTPRIIENPVTRSKSGKAVIFVP